VRNTGDWYMTALKENKAASGKLVRVVSQVLQSRVESSED
jgi:hypothetical protein